MPAEINRTCRKCGDSFAPRPWQVRKSDFSCRACTNARDAAAKARYVRKPGSKRYKQSPEARAVYDARPERKTKRADYRASRRVADAAFKAKLRARSLANRAVHAGRLTKAPCEVCGSAEVEGHHDDYSKPLEVRWLCTFHHREHHKATDLKVAA